MKKISDKQAVNAVKILSKYCIARSVMMIATSVYSTIRFMKMTKVFVV